MAPRLFWVAVILLGGWLVGRRLFRHKPAPQVATVEPAPSAGSAVKPGAPLPAAPVSAAATAPAPAQAALAAPPAAPSPASAAEIGSDVAALAPVLAQSNSQFERLRGDVAHALEEAAKGPGAAGKLKDYPYKVQLVGTAVDRVALRSLAVRNFQTRYTRMMYECSRALGDAVRGARRGQAVDAEAQKLALAKTAEALKTFQGEWDAFCRVQRAPVAQP